MASAMAAAVVGLLGFDAGVVWLVVGVWTIRTMWGAQPGLAWGLACIAAAGRWGTLSLGDVQVATSVAGPTLGTGRPALIGVMAVALAAAVVGEAQQPPFRRQSFPERAADVLAVVALVPLFVAPRPDTAITLLWWAGAGAAIVALIIIGHRFAERLPTWPPIVLAAASIGMGVWL